MELSRVCSPPTGRAAGGTGSIGGGPTNQSPSSPSSSPLLIYRALRSEGQQEAGPSVPTLISNSDPGSSASPSTQQETVKKSPKQPQEPIRGTAPSSPLVRDSGDPSGHTKTTSTIESISPHSLIDRLISSPYPSSSSSSCSSSSTSSFYPPHRILIIDIRPLSTFRLTRIRGSIGLNLPTTLLKRPLYGLDRIEDSLETEEEKVSFSRYRTPLANPSPIDCRASSDGHGQQDSLDGVVVLDTDSMSVNPNHPLVLVLKKFIIAGFTAQLFWLQGGYRSISNLLPKEWIVCGAGSEEASTYAALHLRSSTASSTSSNASSPSSTTSTSSGQRVGHRGSLKMSLAMPPSLTGSPTTPTGQPQIVGSPLHQGYTGSVRLRSSSIARAAMNNGQKTSKPNFNLNMLASSIPRSESPIGEPPFTAPHDLLLTPTQTEKQLSSSSLLSAETTPARFSKRSHPSSQISLLSVASGSSHTHSISSSSNSSITKAFNANPFFDNIRQLNERLSLGVTLQNLTPVKLPRLVHEERDLCRLPDFLADLYRLSETERAERLAREFYDLEMAEQRRLEDVMKWHSSQKSNITITRNHQMISCPRDFADRIGNEDSDRLSESDEHPFSISAGVELGYKNRYKNIWPWEHSRVKLPEAQRTRNGSDYVNASLISFRQDGGPKDENGEPIQIEEQTYIATQGPLGSTFDDFWSMVWSEDVGLIIMLTRKHEAGREKCGDYVKSGNYGEVIINVIDSTGEGYDSDEEREKSGDFFGFGGVGLNKESDERIDRRRKAGNNGIIKKVVMLSLVNRPNLPARKIQHIQYRRWPDFDVPPLAEEVNDLIDQCEDEKTKTVLENDDSIKRFVQDPTKIRDENEIEDEECVKKLIGIGSGPVVVHCSAGVGRTGTFIVLDLMRKVIRRTQCCIKNTEDEKMKGFNLKDCHDRNFLPRFLESEFCDEKSDIAPIWQKSPVMAVVNELREQRMSMVANYRQYVFVHEVLLKYFIRVECFSFNHP